MVRTFMQAIENRRSYYSIGNESPVSDEKIEALVKFAIKNVPSAFNSQSTRVVVLFGASHKRLWNMTKEILRKIVTKEAFKTTESKIDNSFLSGHGTILFFEDQKVVKNLQKSFPTYADNFPIWSQQTSAMHQLVIWTMLEDLGLGANLQHYNPLIDKEVSEEWSIPESWKLISEMPFGNPLSDPEVKQFSSIEDRVKVFK